MILYLNNFNANDLKSKTTDISVLYSDIKEDVVIIDGVKDYLHDLISLYKIDFIDIVFIIINQLLTGKVFIYYYKDTIMAISNNNFYSHLHARFDNIKFLTTKDFVTFTFNGGFSYRILENRKLNTQLYFEGGIYE